MKHLISFLSILLMTGAFALAQQVTLYGFSNGNLVRVNPLTAGVDVVGDIPGVDAIAIGSSTFDHYLRRYICIGGSGSGLVSVDAVTATLMSSVPTPTYPEVFTRELEYDLQYDVLYGLKSILYGDLNVEVQSDTYLSRVNIETGEEELLGELPEIDVIFTNTSTYNSNEGLYTVIGRDQQGQDRIFTIDVETAEIVHQPAMQSAGNLELQYDVAAGKYYGIKGINGGTVDFVEVDITSGEITVLMNTDAEAIALGSGIYSQMDQLFVFIGVDADQQKSFYVLSGENSELISKQPVQDMAIELQADNTNFANFYFNKATSNNSLSTGELSVQLYPNPVGQQLNYHRESQVPATLELHNMAGQLITTHTLNNTRGSIDVTGLANGLYSATFIQGDQIQKRQFLKN